MNTGDNNDIVENEISGGNTGISVGNADDNRVSGNEISSTEYEGILIYNGSTQNEIKENEISDVWWGIVVNNADSNELVENEISDSLTGILVVNSSEYNKVRSFSIFRAGSTFQHVESDWSKRPELKNEFALVPKQ